MFEPQVMQMIGWGIVETLYMTRFSSLLAYIIGLPLGLILVAVSYTHLWPGCPTRHPARR